MVEKNIHSDKSNKVSYQIASIADDKCNSDSARHEQRFSGYLAPEEALFYQMTTIENFIIAGTKRMIKKVSDKRVGHHH